MRLSPAGMDQIEAALDAEPRVIPELAAAIRKSRAQFGSNATQVAARR